MNSSIPHVSGTQIGLNASSSSGSLGLPLGLTVPPTPHPNALRDISIIATPTAVLLRSSSSASASTIASVSYGNPPRVEAKIASATDVEAEWSECLTIYGVLGIVTLFRRSYLLVISSRDEVGDVFEKPVYAIKSIAPIPLDSQTGAKMGFKAIEKLARASGSATNAKASDSTSDVSEGSISDDMIDLASVSDDASSIIDLNAFQAETREEEKELVSALESLADAPLIDPNMTKVALAEVSGTLPPTGSSSSSAQEGGVKRMAQRLAFWSRKPPDAATVDHAVAPVAQPTLGASPAIDTMPTPQSNITHDPTGLLKLEPPSSLPSSSLSNAAPPSNISSQPSTGMKRSELEPKILREIIAIFTHEMYFAYDFDITTSLQRKTEKIRGLHQTDHLLHDLTESPSTSPSLSTTSSSPNQDASEDVPSTNWSPHVEPNLHLPLWRRVDRRFWWNENMLQPFVSAGLHDFVLPVMQGFVQMTLFTMPSASTRTSDSLAANQADNDDDDDEIEVAYNIISRRARQRAGLRYQRRGIDEDANVANFVETESVMSVELDGTLNVFSHVQIRGSIPLFWSQPGLSLKPAPKLDRTPSESQLAMKKHFDRSVKLYGNITVVGLSETTGKEGSVTNAYMEGVEAMKRPDVRYQGFDFHNECRGMKYENISKLIATLESSFAFEHQGYFWASGSSILARQNGVFRVNCIDCLDRTNVVESAFGRYVLLAQLQACALIPEGKERRDLEIVFNNVWANNGDAISRAYAGTSALKGDFTRTGKRDISGMFNDGLNSLARMYSATFTDYFSQAVIDFVLAHRSLSVFTEFMQTMTATDPRELLRLGKIRAMAVESCAQLAVKEGEEGDVRGGWTVWCPGDSTGKGKGGMFEEKVLLLTGAALYIISYDYVLEKIRVVTRVPLINLVQIQKGAYILSPLQDAGRDVAQNYGFRISYRAASAEEEVLTRVTSYSVGNIVPLDALDPTGDPLTSAPATALTDADALSTSLPSSSGVDGVSRTPSKASTVAPLRPASRTRSLSSLLLPAASSKKGSGKDAILSVAFKALPVDHTIQDRPQRSGTNANTASADTDPGSSTFTTVRPLVIGRNSVDTVKGGDRTCREEVNDMCAAIVDAYEDAMGLERKRGGKERYGAIRGPGKEDHTEALLLERDIMSLEEAKRATPVYGKVEYALKRLLWLGS